MERRVLAAQVFAFMLLLSLIVSIRSRAQQSQPTFGHALYAAGYTSTIAKGPLFFDTSIPLSQRILRGVFNPNAAEHSSDGHGNSARWTFPDRAKGPMTGPEGYGPERLSRALTNGCLPEVKALLPAGYIFTQLDSNDALWVTSRTGQSSIWDSCAGLSLEPIPEPEPSPEPCPEVKPCEPCAVCQPCPEPVPVPCPSPIPCPAPPVCPPPPVRCLDAIDALQSRILPLGPGLRAGMRACGVYFREMAASGCLSNVVKGD